MARVSQEEGDGDSANGFLRSWAWKREHRSDKVRFQRPYIHRMIGDGAEGEVVLTIGQARFREQGFASTVWDSSIVMAKYFEKWGSRYSGQRCLDLSAGCGLVGIVLSKLGATVTCTDLAPNLPLLKGNCGANSAGSIHVRAHTWGGTTSNFAPPFDVIVACDVMYIREAVPALLTTLQGMSAQGSEVLIAHGRNRTAEEDFLRGCDGFFEVSDVGSNELDSVYQAEDVRVLRLRRL